VVSAGTTIDASAANTGFVKTAIRNIVRAERLKKDFALLLHIVSIIFYTSYVVAKILAYIEVLVNYIKGGARAGQTLAAHVAQPESRKAVVYGADAVVTFVPFKRFA
jgi:hypothetical protein